MATNTSVSSTIMSWTGRILSGLIVLFLLLDGAIKVMELDVATQTTAQLGYPISVVFGIGILTLAIAAFYAVPRTSALGAILLTGLLGGAIATHLRGGQPDLHPHALRPLSRPGSLGRAPPAR